MTARYFWATC